MGEDPARHGPLRAGTAAADADQRRYCLDVDATQGRSRRAGAGGPPPARRHVAAAARPARIRSGRPAKPRFLVSRGLVSGAVGFGRGLVSGAVGFDGLQLVPAGVPLDRRLITGFEQVYEVSVLLEGSLGAFGQV